MNQFITFAPKSSEVRKIWDHEDILENTTSFVLDINTADHGSIHLHAKRAELEVVYKALDDFFAKVHKAERAEREAEFYAEAMYELSIEGAEDMNAKAEMAEGK